MSKSLLLRDFVLNNEGIVRLQVTQNENGKITVNIEGNGMDVVINGKKVNEKEKIEKVK